MKQNCAIEKKMHMVASNHGSDGVLRHKKGIWDSKEKSKKANKQKRKPTYKYFCDCGSE